MHGSWLVYPSPSNILATAVENEGLARERTKKNYVETLESKGTLRMCKQDVSSEVVGPNGFAQLLRGPSFGMIIYHKLQSSCCQRGRLSGRGRRLKKKLRHTPWDDALSILPRQKGAYYTVMPERPGVCSSTEETPTSDRRLRRCDGRARELKMEET